MPLSARSLAQARVSAADLGGRPAPPDNQSGPSGTVTDSSDGGNGVPSDSAADGLLGGAQAVDTPDVAATGAKQDDPGFGAAATALPVESAAAVASAQAGASIAASRNFAGDFNSGVLGSTAPRLNNPPPGAWGQGGGGGGGGWTGGNNNNNAAPSGSIPVTWLNADVYVIPKRVASNWFSAISGLGAKQVVTIVYERWAAQLNSWGPSPTYRAPSLSQSFAWGAYEYLYYAATTGGWGFKTPSTSLSMYDAFGNRLAVLVRTSLNLRTFEVVSVRVLDYKFSGNNWGK